MKVIVIGLGYIGLPTAAILAKNGVEVVGVDISQKVVNIINKGKVHIEEPGIAEVIKEIVAKNKFRASNKPEIADFFVIAVPTPNLNDGYMSCDLEYVITATESVIPYLKKGDTVIIESTIAPRTTEDFVAPIIQAAGFEIGKDIYLAHCPERVLPGQILNELVNNNRIVGGITKKCSIEAAKLYEIFVKGEIIKTEAKTAEMSKLMENTFRDVNIALANELTKVCNKLDINVLDVIEMANKHPRVNIHSPGPGVGGHCIAVDPYFIYAKAPELAKLIKLSRDINSTMPEFVVEKTEEILNNLNAKIAIFGITYKGNVDDMRESPALEIIHLLKEKGYELSIHDPHVKSDDTLVLNDYEKAITKADIILILADHNEFKKMDYNKISKLMKKPIIFDTKGILNENDSDKVQIITYGNLYKSKKSVIE